MHNYTHYLICQARDRRNGSALTARPIGDFCRPKRECDGERARKTTSLARYFRPFCLLLDHHRCCISSSLLPLLLYIQNLLVELPRSYCVWCLPLELSSPSLHPRNAQGAPKPHQVPQGLSAMQKWSCQGELGSFFLHHFLVNDCLGSTLYNTNKYDRASREPRAHSPFPCEAIHPWLADHHPGRWNCHGYY